MQWQILDRINEQSYLFKKSDVVSFGTHKDCEIKLSNSKNKSIHSQLIFDEGFFFYVIENKIHSYFLNAELKFENQSFFVQFLETYEFQEKFHTIQSIYPSKMKMQQGTSELRVYKREEHTQATSNDAASSFPMGIYKPEAHTQGTSNDHAAPFSMGIVDIFSSEEFLKLLINVQQSFFEFHKFNIQMKKISVQEMIQHAAQILVKTFFHSNSVFDPLAREKFRHILWCLWAQIFEYGILTQAILDPMISEIMVNGHKKIYFEQSGRIIDSNIEFANESELLSLIERICASMGRRIDQSMPYCDARLKEGHRIHAIIPPLSLVGPCLTIRKFPNFSYNIEKLVEQDCLSSASAQLLEDAVIKRKNIVISGGTGTGKTTLLNCLSVFIPQHERILTIEDSAELKLQQKHVIRLESRNENIENQGKITIRDLVKNALRMRPDRIIVGECRGAEALDMLQAMNTGHDGSMTTVHANSPQDALRRLETLVLFAELDLPSRAIREQLASAVDFIVQQSRLPCGKRCVTQIEKVMGFEENTACIKTETIYFLGVQE